ncbi:MAG: hypothetical protein NZ659_05505 [Acidimicrobiales bacterium]|nr:hypothetical protein [Acidimicrobiales bacterium]
MENRSERNQQRVTSLTVMFWFSVLLTAAVLYVAGLLLNLPIWIPPLIALTIVGWVARSSRNTTRRLLACCGETAPPAGNYPRLNNLVDALCLTTGISTPEIRVLSSSARNMAAIGRVPDRSILIITTGLLENTTRVELEAALANRIAQISNHRVSLTTTALSTFGLTLGSSRVQIWPFLLLGPVYRRQLATDRYLSNDFLDDAAGVVLTRYPPGMIEALENLENQHRLPEVDPVTAPLWLADPSSETERPSFEARISSLREI